MSPDTPDRPELPDWVSENRLAIGLIAAAVLISIGLVVASSTGALMGPADGPDTGTNGSVNDTADEGNFTQYPDANDAKVAEATESTDVQATINITAWSATPSSVSIDMGAGVRFNNKVDHAVLINWRDTKMDNITIEAGGSYTARFRGFEYFKIYSAKEGAEGGWPLLGRIDAAS